MKVSLSWLKEYVEINVPAIELCEKMVMAGFEVEEIIDLSQSMKNVVVGKVLEMEPHPDSDHMFICQIDVGTEQPVQIVTGAQNVNVGDLVPAALNNSDLPNGMHIKSGKLRGIMSNGMLCSGEELNLKDSDYPGAEVNGIMILVPSSAEPGTDMCQILKLDDFIIDFKITANRPDCQSVLGIAREVGVVLGTKFELPKTDFSCTTEKIENYISVDVKNFDLCPRYYGRVLKSIKIAESPDWMKKFLIGAGMRPISNIVDITNFVMLETGLPMHAFDLRDIKNKEIIVRNATDGEKITTLDEKDHTLTNDMLVIADGENPSCLAGIMGGLNSEIKDDTTEIFLECAKFRRDSVRKTARKLGIRTEASGRFERGVDITTVEFAMNRAISLVQTLGAGEIVDGFIDKNVSLPSPRKLTVKCADINALLGVTIPDSEMHKILNSLCIETSLENGVLTCLVPSFRDDVEGKADLAEEVMRIYGYDHIIGTTMQGSIVRGKKLPERIKADKVKALMSGNGFNEISTYSFISNKAIDSLSLNDGDPRKNIINIINPLGDEYSTMRTQLATSMLTVLATNYNRKNDNTSLYEISKIFVPKSLPLTEQPLEIPKMCIGMYGKESDFFTLKGAVESVIQLFTKRVTYKTANEPYLHPGRSAVALTGNNCVTAVFGEVHPDTAAKFSVDCKLYLAEIDLDVLYAINQKKSVYKPLPKFPAINRDFALVCSVDIPVAVLHDAIVKGAGRLLENIELFDVYTGSQIPEGQKSVAYRVTLRSAESTLTDEVAVATVGKIVKNLEAAGATLRSM